MKDTEGILRQLGALPKSDRFLFLKQQLLDLVPGPDRDGAETYILLMKDSLVTPKRIVVLVHGIRTNAEWQDKAERLLRRTPAFQEIFPLKYDILSLWGFWCPIFTRQGAIEYVLRELRDIRRQHQAADISIVAHSFGTYAIAKILAAHSDVVIDRLVMCGSIVSKSMRWDNLANYPKGGVLNLCGTRDIWPLVASIVTWGYGRSGLYGCGTNRVIDRFFPLSHSGFFDEVFMEQHWLPFLERGESGLTQMDRPSTPWWIILISKVTATRLLLLITVIILILVRYPVHMSWRLLKFW